MDKQQPQLWSSTWSDGLAAVLHDLFKGGGIGNATRQLLMVQACTCRVTDAVLPFADCVKARLPIILSFPTLISIPRPIVLRV